VAAVSVVEWVAAVAATFGMAVGGATASAPAGAWSGRSGSGSATEQKGSLPFVDREIYRVGAIQTSLLDCFGVFVAACSSHSLHLCGERRQNPRPAADAFMKAFEVVFLVR
jgi:hypothetical protein